MSYHITAMQTKLLTTVQARFARAFSESQTSAFLDECTHAMAMLAKYGQCHAPSDDSKIWLAKRAENLVVSETAKFHALENHLLAFMLRKLASGVSGAVIRRFQERREGMKRKATGDGKAVWQPLPVEKQTALSSDVPITTREEMTDAAFSALGMCLHDGAKVDRMAVRSAYRAAQNALDKYRRSRERASIDDPDFKAERAFLADCTEVNEEMIESRALAIQDAADKAKRALAAHWQASGSRKWRAGLAGDLEILAVALKVTLENEGADDWHKRQSSRTALYMRLAQFRANVEHGFTLTGESPDTLRAIYGEHESKATMHQQSAQDAACVLPLPHTSREHAPQVVIIRRITNPDKRAMAHVARSQRQSVRECEETAWSL